MVGTRTSCEPIATNTRPAPSIHSAALIATRTKPPAATTAAPTAANAVRGTLSATKPLSEAAITPASTAAAKSRPMVCWGAGRKSGRGTERQDRFQEGDQPGAKRGQAEHQAGGRVPPDPTWTLRWYVFAIAYEHHPRHPVQQGHRRGQHERRPSSPVIGQKSADRRAEQHSQPARGKRQAQRFRPLGGRIDRRDQREAGRPRHRGRDTLQGARHHQRRKCLYDSEKHGRASQREESGQHRNPMTQPVDQHPSHRGGDHHRDRIAGEKHPDGGRGCAAGAGDSGQHRDRDAVHQHVGCQRHRGDDQGSGTFHSSPSKK